MNEYVQQSVNSRVDFFEKYYTVPEEVRPAVEAFIADINQLGNASVDAIDFENKFVSSGLNERFNNLLTCCIPKPYKMTDEEKETAKETAKEIFQEDCSRIEKESAHEVLDYAAVMAKEELIAQKRDMMIDAGVFDEYTRATNAVDIAVEGGKFLKNLFKRKK